ncbi:MAG: CotH kinase family protein [Bacteroidaceae bacterium]|nr:CotH kinase family protein [Bacteroidaceae bacterium]
MMKKISTVFMLLCFVWGLTGAMAQDNPQRPKLSGTPIGSPNVDYSTGQTSSTVNTPACAFDGDLNTYYASYDRSFTWVGLDLGTPHVITRIGWSPRNHELGPQRVLLGLFEGSNRPDFLDAVPLYLIPEQGVIGRMDYTDVNVSRGFRYVRYVGPSDVRCNIAELEFYGYEGAGDDSRFYQITNLPTLSIHVYSGQEPYDKTHELESNMTLVYDGGTRIQEYPITARLRGNASQGFPKKPYRIKFNDGKSHHMMKDSPLESPAKAKKWTLINNYGDKTLMRNILSFEVSRRLGMPYTPYCQPVDVVMNGEYKGCYQLCDQITADPNRVNITEMEPSDNEEPNITGGYLVEVDAYASGEKSWFQTKRGMPVTIKEPSEDDITPQQKQYITDYFNLLEDAVFSANFRDSTEGYRKYLDLSSFIKHFIVGEFTGNTDTYWSTYMSKNRNSDYFVVAPSWDFDLAFNNDARIYPVCNRNSWVYTRGGSSAPNMNNFVTRILSDPYADSMLKEMWEEKTASGDFDPESLVHFVDSMAQVLDASQRLNFIRWPILDTRVHENAFALGSYEAEVGVLREYIPERVAWITDYLDYQDVEIRDTTIHIASAEDLINFAKYVNHGGVGSKGILTADIDMEGKTGYQPIGKEGMAYVGEFDGQGHVISNLHIKGGNYTGLFGVVSGGAYIHDFTLDSSCSIEGVAFVGVVGGSNDTGPVTIDKVGNEADVTGVAQNVSGIFGCNMNSSATIYLSNCYNTGRITGGNESATISGWLGSNAVVDNCYNIGEVSGTEGSKTFARGGFSHMNCYETGGRQVPSINASQIADGELCYLLNDGRETWRQNLGSDAHPVLRRTHSVVYYDAGNGSYYNNPDDNPDDVPFIEATMAHYGIYDLKGRLVRKSANGTAGLQKGIYLINGRKVVVR